MPIEKSEMAELQTPSADGQSRRPRAVRKKKAAEPGGHLERNCSVARTMNIFCDSWAFLIMREAFFGVRNFDGFRSALEIPRQTLTSRLRLLVQEGVLKKVLMEGSSKRYEYRLTKKGYDIYPSCMALKRYGDTWLNDDEAKVPLELRHTTCGCVCEPVVACSSCLEPISAATVTYRDGPGAGHEAGRPGRNARRAYSNSRFLVGRPSSVSKTLEIIGDKWSFMVVREAFFGARRYEQMQSRLTIAPNILTDRLAHFVRHDVFVRRQYSSSPPRYEYVLTSKGRDLYAPFIAMFAWGDRWLSQGKPPLILTHKTCGNDFNPVVICPECKQEIDAGSMRYRLNYDPERYHAPTNDHLDDG
ncbi:helix-turn-helix domain-containing protein [Microbaculum marinum]|uniref:Helix-turn-helix domain-containing protein n=1 Tax=Microbaculum marinum TaxID=1764581 RepID=A0AAW9S2R2_9HYPH